MKAKLNAIHNLKKFLHKSEADRHSPKPDPIAAHAAKQGEEMDEMPSEHHDALKKLMEEKD